RLLELVIEHFVPAGGAPGRAESVAASADATTFLLRTSAARARERAAVARAMTPGPTGALLVVDDDEANRTMLARRLMRLGHQGEMADNGRVALEILRA